MAYVETDDSMRWRAEEAMIQCGQVVVMAAADTPYVAVDFDIVLDGVDDLVLTGTPTVTEVDGKTISFSDISLSSDLKRVSFKVASNDGADDYTLRVAVTLNKGTTNQISRQCILRVV